MKKDKTHWYDGWFFEKTIARGQVRLFKKIYQFIPQNSTVVDVGCGTGKLPFMLADRCREVLGVDLSSKNIAVAENLNSKYGYTNINFKHADIADVITENKKKYDYAVITYVIHEMDKEERDTFLKQLNKLADRIIIAEYIYPQRDTFYKWLNELVEFAAGRNHYKNYKLFMKEGGIKTLLEKSGYYVVEEIQNNPVSSHIVIAEKKS